MDMSLLELVKLGATFLVLPFLVYLWRRVEETKKEVKDLDTLVWKHQYEAEVKFASKELINTLKVDMNNQFNRLENQINKFLWAWKTRKDNDDES